MNYSELKAAVANYLNRDDLTTEIASIFIPLAEAKFNRVLIVPEREEVTTLSASAESVSLPANFWGMRSAYVDASPKRSIEQMSLSQLRDTYGFGSTGTPYHYAIQGGETLLLGPEPGSATSIVLNYYTVIPALADSSTSNWLLAAHPDVYIYGTLAEAMAFLRDAEGVNFCEAKTAALLDEVRKSGQRKANGGAPLAPRGPVPTIRGVRA